MYPDQHSHATTPVGPVPQQQPQAPDLKHETLVRSIAEVIEEPVDTVREIYDEMLEIMKTRAAVTDYLPVLVEKRIKAMFRDKLRHAHDAEMEVH